MKKQLIVVFLIITMCLGSLVGCGATPNTPTAVPTSGVTNTPEVTNEPTSGPTKEPTVAPTKTATNTPVPTATNTPVPTATNTPTPTATNTPTPTATNTPTPTATNTPVPTATNTPIPTATNTPVPTASNTPVPTATNTPVPTATNTPAPTATNTPAPTATVTPTPMPTKTAQQKVTYKDENVNTEHVNTVILNLDDKESIINILIGRIYNQGGQSGTIHCPIYAENKQDLLDVVDMMAGINGLDCIVVEEKVKYNNCSYYSVYVEHSTPFRYHYALDTGDTQFLTDEDLQTITKLQTLVTQANSECSTDYEKEKFFHDYLVANIAYGRESGRAGQTPYEALILGKCVCNGYASTFELLMNMAGIPCTFVSGKGNGGSHAWNQALIGGAWYNVDVTWDDPAPDEAGKIIYAYMNVNDDYFYQSHTPSDTDIPVCFAMEYNTTLRQYHECKTQEEANQYAKNEVDKGNSHVEFVYTGSGTISSSEIQKAVGKGYSGTISSCALGKIYIYNFR